MDFIRAAVRGLFYKYPLGRAASCVVNPSDELFLSGLKEVLRWENPQFTTTEIGVLEDVVFQTWTKPYKRDFKVEGIPFPGRALFVLFHLAEEMFDTSSWAHPVLQYEHLLRWRDIAFYVGEDVLAIPFLAEQDSLRSFDRTSFVWERVIRHNNRALNRILDSGLSEVHSHINASVDVFELNWLRLMNEGCFDMCNCLPNRQKTRLSLNDYRQEYSPALWDECCPVSLYGWGIIAATIRTWIYRCVLKGEEIPLKELAVLRMMIEDESVLYQQGRDTKTIIGSFEDEAFRQPNGIAFDYAITKESANRCSEEDIKQPYFVHQGERELMYRFFRMIIDNVKSACALAPYVYLYILIKNTFRREFVQTNPLIGFENFQRYQSRKNLYQNKDEIRNRVNFRYAIQTSLRDIEGEKLETRIAPEQVERRQGADYRESIFLQTPFYRYNLENEDLTFVVHFLKKPDDKMTGRDDVDMERHAKYRAYLQKQMWKIVRLCKDKPSDSKSQRIRIVGIDAAGSELNCRPEVFAPSFRYAQLCGLNNITYHAGEDFYDLIDGLRTIDEVLLFLNYQRGCRIGHALALGIDPHKYYGRRHRNVIMPRQVMLDNLVWLYYKARQMNVELRPATLDFIDNHVHRLYQQIGYGDSFDRFVYWQSMLLRGDSLEKCDKKQELTMRERAAKCHNPLCDAARAIKEAQILRVRYGCDTIIKDNGNQPCSFVLPESIAADVEALQEKMMDEIERRGISIECNPTSNLLIGPFERYDELPLWRFHSVGNVKRHSISVSINTDDKGVFATSLYNEFSLISLAMLKRKDSTGNPMWTPKEVLDYMEQLVAMGHTQRFDPVRVYLSE